MSIKAFCFTSINLLSSLRQTLTPSLYCLLLFSLNPLAADAAAYAEETSAIEAKTNLPLNQDLISKQPFAGSYTGEVEVDRLVAKAMDEFQVPGMAVGILHKNQTVLLKGYGLREIGKAHSVDTNTLFKIASNSKAFTTAALAQLVDQGKLRWDTPVNQLIPEFKMMDPWLTEHLTVADLLTHRAGLNSGAGDLMLWPEPSKFTRADVVHALRFIKADKPFRAQYAYDNLLYIVAGELMPALTGLEWNQYVDQHLMQALGLERCFAGPISQAAKRNMAAPHGVIEGRLQVIERNRINNDVSLMAAAGGIKCSVADMMPWIQTQLQLGMSPSGKRIYSATQAKEMWSPQVIRSVSNADRERSKTHFKAYGLGWRLADVHGFMQISHTGSLSGTRSHVTLVPELDLGVVVLSNGSSSAARQAVMASIVWSYMDAPNVDWISVIDNDIQQARSQSAENHQLSISEAASLNQNSLPVEAFKQKYSAFSGRFVDPWFGEIEIYGGDDGLILESKKSPKLRGELRYQDDNTLTVHWFDRTLEADAYVFFKRHKNGDVKSLTMDLISPDSDFSFDFVDLRLKPVD